MAGIDKETGLQGQKMSLQDWSYQYFKDRRDPKDLEIQAVRIILRGQERFIPFGVFCNEVARNIGLEHSPAIKKGGSN